MEITHLVSCIVKHLVNKIIIWKSNLNHEMEAIILERERLVKVRHGNE